MALKKLNENENIVILKANKGEATMISNKKDYIEKTNDHLNNSRCYKKLEKTPINCIMKDVSKAIKESTLHEEVKKKFITSSPIVPRIYGLLMIHKVGTPLRPIIDIMDSPAASLQTAKVSSQQIKSSSGQ